MAIYMKIDGIKGNVTTKNYQGWVKVNDIDFGGVLNPAHIQIGQVTDRNARVPQFNQIVFIKPTDNSSAKLFEAAHSGTVFKSMEFDYVSSGENPVVYSKLILTNAMVTAFQDRHSDHADQPLEMIRLAYTKMQRTYVPRDSLGKPGSPVSTGYDIEGAAKL